MVLIKTFKEDNGHLTTKEEWSKIFHFIGQRENHEVYNIKLNTQLEKNCRYKQWADLSIKTLSTLLDKLLFFREMDGG